ncbi:MAG TPA: 3'-5' exonuclease [Clostridiales bacterium]|nr:MAG: sporulation inhibitor KapD [Firmicutes bacterium ADurb.Bin262]HOU11377.1 3'-5' exonuclease [Clostridiales bacterium]HQH62905.1 3'-5' exonuclease [Clostridiales bacterium]HQK72936.1 3'-5' exonuclease [Clostridiales bacterium]
MYYIILDLEWNNAYAWKLQGAINEIIEFGAVKLDENLQEVDTFSSLVKSQIGKKLMGRVKRLTNLTNADISVGEPFNKVASEFRKWVGTGDNIILTWGDGDIRVLLDNYRYFCVIEKIPFLTRYADLQKYYQKMHGLHASRQIGLSDAAVRLEIDPTLYDTHRALGDSLLSAECLRKAFDRDLLAGMTVCCDETFYSRLLFKPTVIKKLTNPSVDRKELFYTCENCGRKAKRLTEWKYSNQYFRAEFVCEPCDRKYRVGVRFKKYYDSIDIRKTATLVLPGDDEECGCADGEPEAGAADSAAEVN